MKNISIFSNSPAPVALRWSQKRKQEESRKQANEAMNTRKRLFDDVEQFGGKHQLAKYFTSIFSVLFIFPAGLVKRLEF
jgi:hypothetical protein